MEPAKSKPMSILSDLDPKNTKFRDTRSPGKNSKLFWMLALLPFLAGAVWMVASFQAGMHTSGEDLRTIPAVGQARAASTEPVPAGASQQATPPATDKPPAGAALILAAARPQGEGATGRETETNAFQAMQRELDEPASRPADRQVVKETKAKKAQANAKPAAGARTKSANKGNEGYRASRNASKPAAERDIDIISAIVR
ncbi:MAG: hypothetical protein HYU74_12805 [Dechloromonas sp.]|nr:hypothetical protein [Dechloromonas sp.]